MTEKSFPDTLRRKVFGFIGEEGEGGKMPSDATQKAFAARVGLDMGTLSRLLNRRNGPGLSTLRKLVYAPEVGSEALAALGIIPDDPRIVRLLDQVIQGELTPEQLEAAIKRARVVVPDGKPGPANSEANPS